MTQGSNPILGFASRAIATSRGSVAVHEGGTGLAILLLHGFPETSLMWRDVAPLLAADFRVVVADLPGYGESDCPADSEDHSAMSKRALAETLVEAMRIAGHSRFAIVGHDRGGRVAYRAALDHPEVVIKLAVLDVVATGDVWTHADARAMLAFWPFSLLAQPAPLPEQLVSAAPEAIVDHAIATWGSAPSTFPRRARDAYVDALRDPAHVHAICEEYRAAATIDRELDQGDRDAGRRIACPMLVLWSGTGGLASWYGEFGGPRGLWRRWATDVEGAAIAGGHFFPEELPDLTARHLRAFLRSRE